VRGIEHCVACDMRAFVVLPLCMHGLWLGSVVPNRVLGVNTGP
jgi:hypothetical protein